MVEFFYALGRVMYGLSPLFIYIAGALMLFFNAKVPDVVYRWAVLIALASIMMDVRQ